jgi:hypothetical protein
MEHPFRDTGSMTPWPYNWRTVPMLWRQSDFPFLFDHSYGHDGMSDDDLKVEGTNKG